MTDLDLALRTPGGIVLLEPRRCSALVERSLTSQRPGGLVSGALGMLGLGRGRAERSEQPETLAMAPIRWASDVDYGDGYSIVDGIAVIDIEGVLAPDGYYDWWDDVWVGGYTQIGAAYAAALEDDRVRGIFARLNSPGGLVDGCFDLCDELRAGNGANGGKPFWVHARMACSAAYAIASCADRILAPAEGDVGSIGVVIVHTDISGWLAETGIKVEAIQSAPGKTDGAMWKPLSEEARAHLQGVVDQVARRFTGAVEAGRGLSAEQIVALEARWFLAEHDDAARSGLALGLVDEIATERAAFAAFAESLSETTGSGAPAATGTTAAKPAARASQQKETEMSLEDQIAALRAKASRGNKAALAQLKALGVRVSAKAEDDDDDAAAEEDKEEAKAEDDDDDAAAEGDDDDDDEPAAKATGSRAGFKLLGAKQAKGREDLARKLAEKVSAKKLTYGEAKSMLAAAPRKSRLGDAMQGRDRNPGSDTGGGSKASAGLGAAVDRLNAKRAGGR
ncbi:MAG TPA: S49 family peptidase [Devosiaceae bacterium]|nr:S49 family peptidase [Devosiaceae bacterium]